MTFEEYDGEFIVASKMEWHPYPEHPISDMSEDTYMYFAVANSNGAYTFGSYLGDVISAVDNYGNALLNDSDIYAWSISSLEPPNMQKFKTEIKDKSLIYGIFNVSKTDRPFYEVKLDRQKTSKIFVGTYDECQKWIQNN